MDCMRNKRTRPRNTIFDCVHILNDIKTYWPQFSMGKGWEASINILSLCTLSYIWSKTSIFPIDCWNEVLSIGIKKWYGGGINWLRILPYCLFGRIPCNIKLIGFYENYIYVQPQKNNASLFVFKIHVSLNCWLAISYQSEKVRLGHAYSYWWEYVN